MGVFAVMTASAKSLAALQRNVLFKYEKQN